MKITAVILAAGAARRFGRPKQMAFLRGETLLARAVRVAVEAELSPVIAVVADSEQAAVAAAAGALALINDAREEGMAASVRMGVAEAQQGAAAGVVLMTCDQPGVTAEHLRSLCEIPHEVTGSGYAGKVGVPAYFPAACCAELLQLRGDAGARDLLRNARAVLNEAAGVDVDTEDDLRLAEAGEI